MKHLFIIIIIPIIFNACQNKQKAISTYNVNGNEITKIDITNQIDSSQISLSTLGENLRVVRLETNDSCLFGNADYLIGKKYIIAFSRSNIILFNRDGKYIRTLSTEGKGPGEFRFIMNKAFNKQEDQFFAIDNGQRFIHCWSLPDGKYQSIPLAQKNGAYALNLINDTTLEIAHYRMKQIKYKLYTQTLSGKLLNGFPNTGTEDARRIEYTNSLYNTGTALYYKPHRGDSIFQILSDTLMLKYAVPTKQKQKQWFRVLQLTDQQFIFTIFNITGEKKIVSGKISSTAFDGYYVFYIVDLLKKQITCSRQIKNDYLGIKVEDKDLIFQENGQFYLQYPASKLTTLIPETLEKNDIDATVRQRLEQLKSEINEEDNPILIIGTSKPFVMESK